MNIVIRMVLLLTVLLASYQVGQAQQIEKHGWKLVFVTWLDETTGTEKTDKDYGRPSVAIYAKDYPYKVGQEYPKLLIATLQERLTIDSRDMGPHVQTTLDEFDCQRGLLRTVKTFWTDGSETQPNFVDRYKWNDSLEGSPAEALLKYACRPRTPSKK